MDDRGGSMRRGRFAETSLVASAFVIAALVIVEAGSLPSPSAHAGQAIAMPQGFSMSTVRVSTAGDGSVQELLYVLDGRDELLYIYEVPKASDRRIVFRGGVLLPTLFAKGRGG